MNDSSFNPDRIDPRAFFAEQARIYGEQHREGQSYKRFCRACHRVARTREGQHLIMGLKSLIQYESTSFRDGDGFNSHAAAARDGARGAVIELLVASQIGEKDHDPMEDDD